MTALFVAETLPSEEEEWGFYQLDHPMMDLDHFCEIGGMGGGCRKESK